MAYSTILLDLDHTLLDSDTSLRDAFANTLGQAGLDDPAAHYETFDQLNSALWRQVEAATITPDVVSLRRFEQLVDALEIDAKPADLEASFRHDLGQFGDLYTGTHEVLEALAEVATLAVITNGLSDVQRNRLERLDLNKYLAATIISAEVGYTKPGTEIFQVAFEALGHPAKDTALMVGDNLGSDIRGGTNYGIDTCWYNPHGKAAGPDDVVTHEIVVLQQLVTLLGA